MPFPVINDALARALTERGYTEPTPVQRAVLEPEAAGRDLLVSAQTGSGKTVAFGAALAETLLGDALTFGQAVKPLALIIAPTRELALQVQRELAWLYGPAGATIASCVGGMDIRTEARALTAGCHIVVGTPGRLKDHLSRRRLDLSGLKAVVLDEADEMLDMGFKEDLEYILDATPPERRTLLFSATIANDIEQLARRYQRNALRISTARDREAHADIEYRAIRVASGETERALVNTLRFYDAGAALVFCSTREGVKRLHGSLIERGFAAVALSGELSQAERTNALQSLRDGRSRVCVATDVAARGLDLPDLGLVVHADLPNDRETLLHRSGRTGRAGRKGICVLLVAPSKRRRAELLLRTAALNAKWTGPPSADEVRGRDHERILADAAFTDETAEDDLAIARAMIAARTPDEIALALVRILRTRLPAPEDVTDGAEPGFRDRRAGETGGAADRAGRVSQPFRSEGPGDGADRGPPRERLKSEETVWFRINIGRDRNAEPRWLIPLICKAGGITKAEIGSIRIFDTDTRFQIAKDAAEAFAAAVDGKSENNTTISPAFGAEGRPSTPFRTKSEARRPFGPAGKGGLFKPKPKSYAGAERMAAGADGGSGAGAGAAAGAGADGDRPHRGKPPFKGKSNFAPANGAAPFKTYDKPPGGKPGMKPYKAKKKHKSEAV